VVRCRLPSHFMESPAWTICEKKSRTTTNRCSISLSSANATCVPAVKKSSDFARHDVSPRQFRIRERDLICVIDSWRVRFRCRDCGKVFTEYPPFALPYKRFAKPVIIAQAKHYLGNDYSLRQSVRGTHTPLAYDGPQGQQGQQLSRSTVWKWLTWLGGLKETLRRVTGLVLEKDPQANPARNVPFISAKKFCLQARRDVLHLAARLIAAAEQGAGLFAPSLIFTR